MITLSINCFQYRLHGRPLNLQASSFLTRPYHSGSRSEWNFPEKTWIRTTTKDEIILRNRLRYSALSNVSSYFDDDDDDADDVNGNETPPSSLDLELGVASVWDRYLHNVDENESDTSSDRTLPSAAEILLKFDADHPPESDDPLELELWLECEAQQEAVLKYQKILDHAREQKDYRSLSLVQRQVLRWFPALKAEISNRQSDFMLKSCNNSSHHRSFNRYGPYLCALPAEKIAVISAHEALIQCVLRSGLDGKDGITFVKLAKRLGEAIEEELVVHRALHKRWLAAAKSQSPLQDQSTKELMENISGVNDAREDQNVLSDNDDHSKSLFRTFDRATHQWSYAASHLKSFLEEVKYRKPSAKKRRIIAYAIRRARHILENEDEWSIEERVQLGAALFQILLENTTVLVEEKEEMAFTYEKRWVNHKFQSFVKLNQHLYKMVVSDKLQSLYNSTTRFKPMIVPPKLWQAADDGSYLWLRSDVMRYHGSKTQKDALMNADLTTVFNGLNALASIPWKINQKVLAAAKFCWEQNIPLGDIPSRTDFELPELPVEPDGQLFDFEKESPEYKEALELQRSYREALNRHRRIRQKNSDLISLRCSALLKLDQAQKFSVFEKIYFPYNVDFRGRAYPIPPHLSNVGSDLCRGMLMFAESKPLGPRGMYWLKVHLANFAGKNKMSFDQRVAFVDDNIGLVRETAANPFAGERWWMSLEDPFQSLATCIEIINAIDSGDPESYECCLAVHMDGSCNGLQHYAALGRDLVGGKAVNLCPTEEPQDVYIGVMHEVIRRVAEEASRTLDYENDDMESLTSDQRMTIIANRAAKLVDGLIDRGVVKRTVMTSVYGVTFIGARQQILEKIESKLESQGYDIDEINREVFSACGYLAKITMSVMGDLFQGARDTMTWLTASSRLIAQHGYPVAWISPIGLPIVQPYRQKKSSVLVTLMQSVTLIHESDNLPIHKHRQVTAFPPNFVHCLDSSHMLLTALEMKSRNLAFSAVHDSFWTHAGDVDEMNVVLRDVFVDLYSDSLLRQLKQTWELRYPQIEFPDLPAGGKLDLNKIKQSKYFFQ